MAGFRIDDKGAIPNVEPGIYPMRLVSREAVTNEFNGETRQQYKCEYEITEDSVSEDGTAVGETLIMWVNRKIDPATGEDIVNPKSNLYAQIKAHLGGSDLEVGFEGDLDDVFEKYPFALGVIEEKTNTKGQTRPVITKLMPVPRSKRRVAAAAPTRKVVQDFDPDDLPFE